MKRLRIAFVALGILSGIWPFFRPPHVIAAGAGRVAIRGVGVRDYTAAEWAAHVAAYQRVGAEG